jgi:hypothetical protein
MSSNSVATSAIDHPQTLYHYCGVDGFCGIMKSREIWLSSAAFTNDYVEHNWLLNKARQRVQQLIDSSDEYKYLRRVWGIIHASGPHLCCFSSNGDLLSQWRAYSDDGAGFAIGFSYEAIAAATEALAKRLSFLALGRVDYNELSQDAFLERYLGELKKSPVDDVGTEAFSDAVTASLNIWMKAAFFKNPAFAEEAEWRIVLEPQVGGAAAGIDPSFCGHGTSDVRFRVSGNRIVPYFAFPFSVDTVKEIILGPKNLARDDLHALKFFLASNGYKVFAFSETPLTLKIGLSRATYR